MSLVIFCPSPEKRALGQKLLPKLSCIWIKMVLFPFISLTTGKKYGKNLFIAHILQKYYILFINVLKNFF